MDEYDKVLGFKEKDAFQTHQTLSDIVIKGDWIVCKNDLVPVVSLQALQKWCKERYFNKPEFQWQRMRNKDYDDLLAWAKKEAGAGKE